MRPEPEVYVRGLEMKKSFPVIGGYTLGALVIAISLTLVFGRLGQLQASETGDMDIKVSDKLPRIARLSPPDLPSAATAKAETIDRAIGVETERQLRARIGELERTVQILKTTTTMNSRSASKVTPRAFWTVTQKAWWKD